MITTIQKTIREEFKKEIKKLHESPPKTYDPETSEILLHLAKKTGEEYSDLINRRKGEQAGYHAALDGTLGGSSALVTKLVMNMMAEYTPIEFSDNTENIIAALIGLLSMYMIARIKKRILNRRRFRG